MKELYIFLLAMTPINELRATIPIGISSSNIPVWKVFCLAVLGNMIPVFFLLLILPWVTKFLMQKSKKFNRFFNWLFNRTRKNFYKNYSLYGNLGLAIFVAIPLPMTGAWSGAIAAFLFGVPYWRAVGWIFLGVISAGLIVTGLSLGVISMF